MTKLLVTGAAGFIGFHLILRLLSEENIKILGIDNINNYYSIDLKEARLRALDDKNKNLNYSFEKIDISNKKEMDKIFEKGQFDMVIHLAAQAGVRYSIENPDAYIESNVVGFMSILEGCRKHGVDKLIYASSSSVYGLNKKVPFSEYDFVDSPISLYAATKKSNELMAHTYSHLYKIKTTGLRFFTVYGPYGRPDMAYYKFTKNIAEGKPIEVFNNGDMSRDFTYIDDIINGVLAVMRKNIQNDFSETEKENGYYKIYNIGNNKPEKLSEFIEIIEGEVGKKAVKINLPMQMGDVYKTYANIDKIQHDLGYLASTDIKTGLKKFVDWYKGYHGI